MQRTKNYKRTIQKTCILGVIMVLVLTLTACGNTGTGQTSSSQPTPTPFPTPIIPEKPIYTVQSGTVVKTLEFTGRASPLLEQELFFRADGFVGDVFVERGDWVQAGDVLAELEIGDLEFQLGQIQLALQTAESNLAQTEQNQSDSLYLEQIALEKAQISLQEAQEAYEMYLPAARLAVDQAKLGVDQARNSLSSTQANRDSTCGAADRGDVPQSSCDSANASVANAEIAVQLAEISYQQAKDTLGLAQAEYDAALSSNQAANNDLRRLELDIAVIEFNIEQLERGVNPMLNLDLAGIQLQIENLERQIADARLIAPFEGKALSVGIDPGDYASAFSTVLVLADPSELEITTELGAEQLSEMALDQEALITLRNRPEEAFGGSVRQLPYPYGGGTTDASDDDPAVHITVEEGVELTPGELATVVIALEEKESVLWLPPAAIRTFQGRDFVVVQLDEGQQRVDVLLGIESEERVEIVQGLEEGQIIVGE